MGMENAAQRSATGERRQLGISRSLLLSIRSARDEVGFSELPGAHSTLGKGLVSPWGASSQPPSYSSCSPTLGPKQGQENPLCSGQTVQSLVAIAATAISERPGLGP